MGARLDELVRAHGRLLEGRGGAELDGRGGAVLGGCKGQPVTLGHVRWSYIMDNSGPDPPTAVFLHGILGCRKNWGRDLCSETERRVSYLAERESITILNVLVKVVPRKGKNLRCHGDSASIQKRRPHTVASAALDVLNLLGQLRLTPRVVVGHSFGGKVALSMVEQAAKPLARPVRVWVLDATPGKVRAGGDGDDHPAELISFLSKLPKERPRGVTQVGLLLGMSPSLTQLPLEVSSKRDLVNALVREGFSTDVAQWVATNLRPKSPPGSSSSSSFSWVFDLDGIAEMKVVEDVPRGVHVNFLKAERSLHRWALGDLQRIHSAEEQAADDGGGVEMHVLEDAGHWFFVPVSDGAHKE
ncbi:hypothetical protein RJ639_012789 [Escallonia herrerae]|uniref:AB hydrolase-1 domain-containing protein n=1 Tax=Escallonia herrerae TaxID=1293975 RepID=A0AA89APW2_9ASTE|nr:hypothetical protein RJ639_012789 [Escallonia herrerae]